MKCVRNFRVGLLPRLHGHEPVAAVGARPPQLLTSCRYYIRQVVSKPAICRLPGPWPPRRYRGTSPAPITATTPWAFRWYHYPWKVAAAVCVLSGAALMAFCHRCLEVVPCTNRAHLVYLSPRFDRERGESEFAAYKEEEASRILSPLHPYSVRVRLIAHRIIHAAYHGLGIYDSRDAVILCVTGGNQNGRKQQAWKPQPQTSHLIVMEDRLDYGARVMGGGKLIVPTGLFLHGFTTDGEIAYTIAHEVAHIIARHESDITWGKWVPIPLWGYFRRRMETEADHIGLLILAAAGFNPHIALAYWAKKAKMADVQTLNDLLSGYPECPKRFQFLSQPKIMDVAPAVAEPGFSYWVFGVKKSNTLI